MSEPKAAEASLPIGVVARRTGLTAEVIRAWEQRYGAIEPARTDGGQRLYTEAEVERLRLLAAAVASGHRIGAVARLSEAALRASVPESPGMRPTPPRAPMVGGALVDAEALVAEGLVAAAHADARALREQLTRATVMLDPMAFLERVMAPLLHAIGERWEAGQLTPAHEHVASTVVRDVLGWLLEMTDAPDGAPLVLVGVPVGQRHEFGALLAGVTAGVAGWSVLQLGGELPARDIVAIARQKGARAVAMSVVHVPDEAVLARELEDLREGLGSGTALLVGGAAAGTVVKEGRGIERIDDLAHLRARLEAIADEAGR